MKRIKKWLTRGLLGLLLGGAWLASADTPIPAPVPPYLAALPALARVVMTGELHKKPADSQPAPVYVKQYEMIKAGDIKHGVIVFSNGTRSDQWIHRGNFVSVVGNPPHLFMRPARDALVVEEPFPFGADDFSGLDWVAHARYRGVATVDQEKCYLFDSGSDLQIWISVLTHYPLLLERENVTYRFSYPPPPPSLALPPALTEAVSENDRLLQRLTSRRKPE